MKRLILFTMIFALMTSCALAEPLKVAGELSGSVCWPEEPSEDGTSYTYTYTYPVVEEMDDVTLMINEFYRYTVDDALAFNVPINGESLEPGTVGSTTIVSDVTCNNDDFFCVRVEMLNDYGYYQSTITSAQVFARRGSKAGSVVSLPYLLGLLDVGDADEWLETRQTAKANECVRQLIWDMIEARMDAIDFYDGLDYDWFSQVFYPEEDFYLNENGDPVFFIVEGMIAPAAEGTMYFPFTLDDLLDEI